MAKLFGAQRLVLQAIQDSPMDAAGFVTDVQVAQGTNIALGDVRDWIETLEGEGLVEVARTTGGLKASITAKGRQQLRLFQPTPQPQAVEAKAMPPEAIPSGSRAVRPETEKTPPAASSLSDASEPFGSAATPMPATGSSDGPDKPYINVFYSYSHKDEALRNELEEALALLKRQGYITDWHDRAILGGQQWADEISEHLESAQIILLLVSSSFLASDYCYGKEMGRALRRHEASEAVVIPVIVRDCDWHDAPFAKLQALPKNAKAVTSWQNKDEAWTDVARGIRRAVEAMTVTHRPSSQENLKAITDNTLVNIELTIDRDFSRFTLKEQNALLGAISQLLGIRYAFTPRGLRDASDGFTTAS